MGQMKAIWGQRLEQITNVMDAITNEYNKVLTLYDYFDHLQDFFEVDELEEFETAILEHYEYLEWENETALCSVCKEKQEIKENKVFQDIKGRFIVCVKCNNFIEIE